MSFAPQVRVSAGASDGGHVGRCHPALVGEATPPGTYALSLRGTEAPGYGGDLLVFRENATHVWAVHRVIAGRPGERRAERLRGGTPGQRRGITAGCVNVDPAVYRALARCCDGETLVIRAP